MPSLDDESLDVVVDARGHRCPVPTLRLRRALHAAPAGAVVRLIADDPLARVDAPHFAAQAGLEVLGICEVEGRLEVRVRAPEAGKRRVVGENDAPPEDVY
jgi:tRNA 2-thiouridine synthesizing protein A